MRAFVIVALLLLAGCGTLPSQTNIALYSTKLTFDGAVKTFNAFKAACTARALPPACRGYVVQGQGVIAKAYAYERAANSAGLSTSMAELMAIVGALQSLKS